MIKKSTVTPEATANQRATPIPLGECPLVRQIAEEEIDAKWADMADAEDSIWEDDWASDVLTDDDVNNPFRLLCCMMAAGDCVQNDYSNADTSSTDEEEPENIEQEGDGIVAHLYDSLATESFTDTVQLKNSPILQLMSCMCRPPLMRL